MQPFEGFDFSDFWERSDYALKQYVESPPTEATIVLVEQELGYTLPAAFVALMKLQNGGIPKNSCFPTTEPTSWADNHIAISGIFGIGRTKTYSLCGELGSRFHIEEWGYPDDGVYFCDCPSAGHDLILLDYTKCGKNGEPEVVHVDQESDYKKTFLAKDFETFIRGLVHHDVYDTSEEDLAADLEMLRSEPFSLVLQGFFSKDTSLDFDKALRNLLIALTQQKGYFALHGDELSHLAYATQFYLLSINRLVASKEDFAKQYPAMLAMNDNGISTKGYGDFFSDWFEARANAKDIVGNSQEGYRVSEHFKAQLFAQLRELI